MSAARADPALRLSMAASTHAATFNAIAYKGALKATVAELAGLGFDGIELAIRDPQIVRSDELAELVASHALVVPAIGTGQAFTEDHLCLASASPEVRRSGCNRLLSHIPLAARLDAILIVGLLGTGTIDGQPRERALGHLVSALQVVSGAAADAGVRIAIEPLNRYEGMLVNDVDEGLDLLERVGAANVGLLLDTFHMNIEEPSIVSSISRARDRLFHFHVADSNRHYPGAGHIDFAAVIGALAAVGYDGFVSGEFMALPDAETAARRFFALMRSLRIQATTEGGDPVGTLAEGRSA